MMPDRNELAKQITALVDQRVALETKLQNEPGELSESRARQYGDEYSALQRNLAALFKQSTDESQRITLMLELMRILENRLVYLHNFIVDTTSDNRILAQLVTQFIEQLGSQRSSVLTNLEATYYRAVATLYAGDVAGARTGFSEACASEESDEANDIKYKSYVILGHLSHEAHDYAGASFEKAAQSQKLSENEYIIDTWFWIARTHLKRNDRNSAKPYLEKIAATDVKYEKKAQAVELLQKIA